VQHFLLLFLEKRKILLQLWFLLERAAVLVVPLPGDLGMPAELRFCFLIFLLLFVEKEGYYETNYQGLRIKIDKKSVDTGLATARGLPRSGTTHFAFSGERRIL
jgi:hypothetical protein